MEYVRSSGISIGGLGGDQGITNASATISHSDIIDTSGPGIYLAPRGDAEVRNNRIMGNAIGIGLNGRYEADITLRSNSIYLNADYGIRNRDVEATPEFPAFEDVVDAKKTTGECRPARSVSITVTHR